MKILIVRIGAMGDVLHALPAVAALRRERPEWQIDWVIDWRWAPLLADVEGDPQGPVVSNIHLAQVKLWKRSPLSLETLHSLRKLRRELRAEQYELVVDMQGTLRSAMVGRSASAPVLAGYADPREAQAAWLYNRRLARHGAHVVDQGFALLSEATGISLQPDAAPLPLPIVEWSANWAEEETSDRRVCVLAPGAGWGAKCWSTENFGALAQQLAPLGFDVVVNAPRKDDAVAASVIAASNGTARLVVFNVTGLIALVRRATLFVGGDSGPTHLAAALGIPLVALFGPTDPARNGPRGPGPCRVLRDAGSRTSHKRVQEIDAGLARITVEQVMAAVRELRDL